MLPKPRAILFDWDNTLVDTWPLIHRALNATMEAMGHEAWSMEKVQSNVSHSMRDAFPALFGEAWPKASQVYQDSYRAMHLSELSPLPGAEAVVKALAADGLFLGIVSNKKGDSLRKELEHLGWKDYFRIAVGADDAKRDKPHAEPVIMALENSGIEPGSEVWFIGDTVVDLECAKATACTAILYGDVESEHGWYKGFPFHTHVRNHAELLQLVENVLKQAA